MVSAALINNRGINDVLKLSANYLTSDVLGEISKGRELSLSPEHFANLILISI
jgi:hypothetical protein